jgi:hypothetical protein
MTDAALVLYKLQRLQTQVTVTRARRPAGEDVLVRDQLLRDALALAFMVALQEAIATARRAGPDAQLVTVRGESMKGVAELEKGLTTIFETRGRKVTLETLGVPHARIRKIRSALPCATRCRSAEDNGADSRNATAGADGWYG